MITEFLGELSLSRKKVTLVDRITYSTSHIHILQRKLLSFQTKNNHGPICEQTNKT